MRSEAEIRERLDASVANVLYGSDRDKATMDAAAEEIRLLCWVLKIDEHETNSLITRYRYVNRRLRD